jgi:hypothetical protein
MNCVDIVIKILNNVNGSDTLISSNVCKEWDCILQVRKNKYMLNLYLFKLRNFVKKYEMCYYDNIYSEYLLSKPNQLLQTKLVIAKMNIRSFFAQRNLKFNKYIFYQLRKMLKPYVSTFLDDIENGFDIDEVLDHLCADNMIIELNRLKKLC